jgi:hypothetical protein
MELTNAIALGYEDPALEGQTITFVCVSRLILSGPNISTCMGNGEWEPDPREVECTGSTVTVTTSGTALITTTIGTYVCISTCQVMISMYNVIQCFNARTFSLSLLKIFPTDLYLL